MDQDVYRVLVHANWESEAMLAAFLVCAVVGLATLATGFFWCIGCVLHGVVRFGKAVTDLMKYRMRRA